MKLAQVLEADLLFSKENELRARRTLLKVQQDLIDQFDEQVSDVKIGVIGLSHVVRFKMHALGNTVACDIEFYPDGDLELTIDGRTERIDDIADAFDALGNWAAE